MFEEERNNQVEEQVEDTTDQSDEDTTESNEADYEETDSTGEGEGATEDESQEQRQPETPDAKRARLKRQIEREAKKQGISVEEFIGQNRQASDEGSEERSQESDKALLDRLDRQDLRFEGVSGKKEQDMVMEYARFKNIDVLDALKTPVVKAELKAMRDKAATPAPSRRTGGQPAEDTDALVRKYKAGKKLSQEQFKKVRKALRG